MIKVDSDRPGYDLIDTVRGVEQIILTIVAEVERDVLLDVILGPRNWRRKQQAQPQRGSRNPAASTSQNPVASTSQQSRAG